MESKIAVLEVHIENIKKEIERLEKHVSTIDGEFVTYKLDLQEAIVQCKGITSQVTSMFAEIKRLDETVGHTTGRVTTIEKETKETIWKFIKEHPTKAVQITLMVLGVISIFVIMYFGSIEKLLHYIGVSK